MTRQLAAPINENQRRAALLKLGKEVGGQAKSGRLANNGETGPSLLDLIKIEHLELNYSVSG